MRTLKYISLIAFVLVAWACSKDITPPASVSHPSQWNDTTADNFHGNKVITVGNESCKSCHGNTFGGGTSGVSCFDCHTIYPHRETWTVPKHPESHGEYLDEDGGSIDKCKSCHGENLDGGNSGVACSDCHGSYDDD